MKLLRIIHLPYSMRSAVHRTSILTLIISWVYKDYYIIWLVVECFFLINILKRQVTDLFYFLLYSNFYRVVSTQRACGLGARME